MKAVLVYLLTVAASVSRASLQTATVTVPGRIRSTRPSSDPLAGLVTSSQEPASVRSLDVKINEILDAVEKLSQDVIATKRAVTASHASIEQLLHFFIKSSCAELTGADLPSPATPQPAISRQSSMEGIFNILPPTGNIKRVKCDHSSDGDVGWTVVLLRQDGSVMFNRTLDEYIQGFGDPSGEVWIGLETLHALTNSRPHQLRVELTDFSSKAAFARYASFRVGSASESYKLSVGGYESSSTAGDALSDHNNAFFSTIDSDKDTEKQNNCASQLGGGGGWWYKQCYHALGTGAYRLPRNRVVPQAYGGVTWHPFSNVKDSLKTFKILIKPLNNP